MSAGPPFGNTKTGGHPVPASGTDIWDGMADNPESTQEKASREATDWLLLLQEEPNDPTLLRRFDEWLFQEGETHNRHWPGVVEPQRPQPDSTAGEDESSWHEAR